jgi:phage pi2 protein 07
MILYHASDVEVKKPEIRKAVYAKDFGFGFYCTANYAQAERWAKRDRNLVSVINHYFCRHCESDS